MLLFCQLFSYWPVITVARHYDDVTMSLMASQITSLTIVYSTVYSGGDQRKPQSSASLAFVRGIHRGPVNSPHKWPVTRKMFPFDDVIMVTCFALLKCVFMVLPFDQPYFARWHQRKIQKHTQKNKWSHGRLCSDERLGIMINLILQYCFLYACWFNIDLNLIWLSSRYCLVSFDTRQCTQNSHNTKII